MTRVILTLAVLAFSLNAYVFENKPRVDDVNASVQVLLNNVTFDGVANKLTVIKVNGSSFDIDLSSLASGGSSNAIKTIALDSAGKKLVLTKVDDTITEVSIAEAFDNVNIVSGTLDVGSKSIKLILNDASNTVVSVDMSSIYNYIDSVQAKTVNNLEYSNNNIRLKLNDNSEKVANIPNATPSANGLFSKEDKDKLDKTFLPFSFDIDNDLSSNITKKNLGGVAVSGMTLKKNYMQGFMVGDGTNYMISAVYKFVLGNISGVTVPTRYVTDIRIDPNVTLDRIAPGLTIVGVGSGVAVARCRVPGVTTVNAFPLAVSFRPGIAGLRFHTPNLSNVSDGGASVAIEECSIRGSISVMVSR